MPSVQTVSVWIAVSLFQHHEWLEMKWQLLSNLFFSFPFSLVFVESRKNTHRINSKTHSSGCMCKHIIALSDTVFFCLFVHIDIDNSLWASRLLTFWSGKLKKKILPSMVKRCPNRIDVFIGSKRTNRNQCELCVEYQQIWNIVVCIVQRKCACGHGNIACWTHVSIC